MSHTTYKIVSAQSEDKALYRKFIEMCNPNIMEESAINAILQIMTPEQMKVLLFEIVKSGNTWAWQAAKTHHDKWPQQWEAMRNANGKGCTLLGLATVLYLNWESNKASQPTEKKRNYPPSLTEKDRVVVDLYKNLDDAYTSKTNNPGDMLIKVMETYGDEVKNARLQPYNLAHDKDHRRIDEFFKKLDMNRLPERSNGMGMVAATGEFRNPLCLVAVSRHVTGAHVVNIGPGLKPMYVRSSGLGERSKQFLLEQLSNGCEQLPVIRSPESDEIYVVAEQSGAVKMTVVEQSTAFLAAINLCAVPDPREMEMPTEYDHLCRQVSNELLSTLDAFLGLPQEVQTCFTARKGPLLPMVSVVGNGIISVLCHDLSEARKDIPQDPHIPNVFVMNNVVVHAIEMASLKREEMPSKSQSLLNVLLRALGDTLRVGDKMILNISDVNWLFGPDFCAASQQFTPQFKAAYNHLNLECIELILDPGKPAQTTYVFEKK